MTIYLTAGLLLAGGLFGFLAAVGMLRLPDMITRMHASTKAGTLGAGLILTAVAIHFMEVGISLRYPTVGTNRGGRTRRYASGQPARGVCRGDRQPG